MVTHEITPLLVAVDIGNSRIKLGRFRAAHTTRGDRVTDAAAGQSLPEPMDTLELLLTNRAGDFDVASLTEWWSAGATESATWLVSSVHRGAAEQFAAAVGALAQSRNANFPLRTLAYCDVPLPIDVEAPERVGIDRLLGAVAADHLRRRDRAAIVVDSGTAITVDLVTAAGEFAGGAILPGIAMSARALEEQTDALPHVAIEAWNAPPPPLGKATVPAIESGLYWGAVGAIRELVTRLSQGLAPPPEVFVSGGNGRLVAEQLAAASGIAARYVPHLVLGGIAIVGGADSARN
jgi:type III pantothenate kinase